MLSSYLRLEICVNHSRKIWVSTNTQFSPDWTRLPIYQSGSVIYAVSAKPPNWQDVLSNSVSIDEDSFDDESRCCKLTVSSVCPIRSRIYGKC